MKAFDTSNFGWRVYRDLSNIDNDPEIPRLGITYGLLSHSNNIISTNDIPDGGTYNVARKDLEYPTEYEDVFLDASEGQYLYASVNISTFAISLVYDDASPSNITISTSVFQLYPLAYIDDNANVIDLRAIVIAGGSGSSTVRYPFDIFTEDLEDDLSIATFWPGTVNQILPSNMFDEFAYDPNTDIYFKLTCTSDGASVTSATLFTDTDPTILPGLVMNGLPTSFDILIAAILTNTPQKVWGNANILAAPNQVFVSDKVSITPGTSVLDRWWTWQIREA